MNLSLLIHTFNGYRHVWPGCLEAWKGIDLPIPMYFGTDEPIDYDFQQFTPLYSGAWEWSDRLRSLLSKIDSEYVFYIQEDHWPTRKPPIEECLHLMERLQLDRLQISPVNQFYTLTGAEIPLYFYPTSKYLVSHQPSIWRKSFLLECLQPGETPWINEYEGTKRINGKPYKIAIYPYDWYQHACVRGNLVV